jgi:hypothetical protein
MGSCHRFAALARLRREEHRLEEQAQVGRVAAEGRVARQLDQQVGANHQGAAARMKGAGSGVVGAVFGSGGGQAGETFRVRGPVLRPPCMRQRPLDMAGARQGSRRGCARHSEAPRWGRRADCRYEAGLAHVAPGCAIDLAVARIAVGRGCNRRLNQAPRCGSVRRGRDRKNIAKT